MSKVIRVAVSSLALSAAALVGLAIDEGYTDNAIIPTKGDVPTFGFGATEGVKMGDKTNPVQAIGRLLKDVNKYEGAMKKCVTAPLTQGEYDVYAKFAYNIGTGGFCGSTVVSRLNKQDYAGACDAILMWKKAGNYDCSTLINGKPNKQCYGLWERRLEAKAQCLAAGK